MLSWQLKECRRTQRAPPSAGSGGLVGVGAFSGSLRGLELVPSKWCSLVPPTSTPQGHNAHRWAAEQVV